MYEYGDPYVEWQEENSAQECNESEEQENMFDVLVLNDDVVKLLMSEYDFLLEDAEEAVDESVKTKPDYWNENASAEDLAKSLATDDDES